MKTIPLILFLMFLLSGCMNNKHTVNISTHTKTNNFATMAGAKSSCPAQSSSTDNIYNETISRFCFSQSVKSLLETNQIFSEVKWLNKKKDFITAERIILEAISLTNNSEDLKKLLIEVYVRQNKWTDAESIVNDLNIKVNDPIRANVKNDLLTYFDLTRVDDAAPNVPSMEPSIKVSNDGQHILVAWMDDISFPGVALQKGRSAYSSDAGVSWTNNNVGTLDSESDYLDFDLITAYDSNNNYMYIAGDTTTPWSTELEDSMFV